MDTESCRTLYATGKFTQTELAMQYGVHQGTISTVVRRAGWKRVA